MVKDDVNRQTYMVNSDGELTNFEDLVNVLSRKPNLLNFIYWDGCRDPIPRAAGKGWTTKPERG